MPIAGDLFYEPVRQLVPSFGTVTGSVFASCHLWSVPNLFMSVLICVRDEREKNVDTHRENPLSKGT